MTTQWHRDRTIKFCTRDVAATLGYGYRCANAEASAADITAATASRLHFYLVAQLQAAVLGFRLRRTYKPHLCVLPQTDAHQEETTKTLIADICANERRIKQ